VLERFIEVPEDHRHRADHVVRVDELVAVLQRLRDRDPALIRRVCVAELPEGAVRVADRVEAERDLAQKAELLRDAEGLFRRAEGAFPVGVAGARELARREGARRQQPDPFRGRLVADQREAARDEAIEVGVLRVPSGDQLGHVRVHRPDLLVVEVRPALEHEPRPFVGREGRIALAVVPAHAADEVQGFDGVVDIAELLVQLGCLLRESQRFDVGVDVHRALRGLPRVHRRLVGDLAEQVVVRERRVEVADLVRQHVLDRQRHATMQLGAPAHEQRVVRDLLRDRVLEPESSLAPLAGRAFDDQVGRDEDVDRVGKTFAAGRSKHPIAEPLADD
jgi:hypothetical protein